MKASLYDALGIAPTASDEEVRAALRGLIRKYYAKTRDGQGNVEEALRFVNHASRILGDSARRERYDQELTRSARNADPRPADIQQMLLGTDEHTEVGAGTGVGEALMVDPFDTSLADDDDEPPLHHPGLTERVTAFGRSSAVTFGLCGLFAVFIAAAIAFVTPPEPALVVRRVLAWLGVTLLVVLVIYGVVHAIAYLRRRESSARSTLSPDTDLAILNWRRERSVFLGAEQPREDASWIFQLRMAELERAKSGRTSEPRPWHRLAARMFDYAIWGLTLALLLSQLRTFGLVSDRVAAVMIHPLLAPLLVTLSWVPIEALLVTAVGTTPGKWLFGLYLQFSISNAYAHRNTTAQLARGLRRALRVWCEGVACGFPLLAPILIAVAYEKLAEKQETDWDFAEDCLVTHGPAGVVSTVTGVCGLASMMWLYGVAWQQPMNDSLAWTRATIADMLPVRTSVRGPVAGMSADVDRVVPARPTSGAVGETLRAPAAAAPAAAKPTDTQATPAPVPAPGDEYATIVAARRARIAQLQEEGPRMLQAGNARRAAELCHAWVDLDVGNADAWRCLGRAQQSLGLNQDALNSFRKAKQHDPLDRSLDAAIERAQRAMVADFLNRYSR